MSGDHDSFPPLSPLSPQRCRRMWWQMACWARRACRPKPEDPAFSRAILRVGATDFARFRSSSGNEEGIIIQIIKRLTSPFRA